LLRAEHGGKPDSEAEGEADHDSGEWEGKERWQPGGGGHVFFLNVGFFIMHLIFGTKKLLLILVLAIVSLRSYSQDSTVWNAGAKLTWADFKGKVDSGSSFIAVTVSGIQYKLRFDNRGLSDSVFAVFYKAESWVKAPTEKALAHEQVHFDITEVFARRLRKRFGEFIPKRGSLNHQLEMLYDEVEAAREAEERLYDQQTGHGSNAVGQAEWEVRIQNELRELEEFGE
jgi:Bacterial protein of unknown function (DUF922)